MTASVIRIWERASASFLVLDQVDGPPLDAFDDGLDGTAIRVRAANNMSAEPSASVAPAMFSALPLSKARWARLM
ncbi:MAG: hypothetical protein ACLPVY_19375 [Acidimicrobiia bacterium]